MSFDPRTPFEIHYVESKSGDEIVECLATREEAETRARQLVSMTRSRPGTLALYHITRTRFGVGARP